MTLRAFFLAALYKFVRFVQTEKGTQEFREADLSVERLALPRINQRPTVADSVSSRCELTPPIKAYPSLASAPGNS